MLPESFKKWGILIVIVIGFVIVSSFFLSKSLNSNLLPIANTSQKRAFPTEVAAQLNNNINLIYQDPADKAGRTVIYTEPQSTSWGLGGHGINELGSRSNLEYAVGLFRGWVPIDGTKDRYILLYDPVDKKDLPRFRVAFQPSPLFDGTGLMTSLGMENLTKLQSRQQYVSMIAQRIADLTPEKLADWIHKDDALGVVAFWREYEEGYRRDENGELLARVIYIRRN